MAVKFMFLTFKECFRNLLENVDTGVRCNIRYTVTFYRGVMSKKSDYMLQVFRCVLAKLQQLSIYLFSSFSKV